MNWKYFILFAVVIPIILYGYSYVVSRSALQAKFDFYKNRLINKMEEGRKDGKKK